MDPHRPPRRVVAPQLEDAIDEVPVGPFWASVGTPRLVPKPLDALLSAVSAPTAQSALGDSEDPAEFRGSRAALEMLASDLQSEADIFPDQADPFPGPVICPVSSAGQMSCQRTNTPNRNEGFLEPIRKPVC